ncbi:MAG: PQQ-binding-like beta-propeller repeat protein, partial [Nevskiales bacterium]
VAPGTPDENKGDPALEAAAKTWTGEWWKTGTGGAPWNSLTFDKEMNRVYVATGNAAPYDQQKRGMGDNLYTASIVALDADTGKYSWHYQINPADSWDYDSTQQMTLATLEIDGKPRKVLMQAPKNGFFYAIDRETGKVISAGKTTEISWAKGIDIKTGKPIENPGIRYESGRIDIWPGPIGGHNWQSMSYSPKLGLVFLGVGQLPERLIRGDGGPDSFNVMGLATQPLIVKPGDGKATLVAWDPVNQREAWRVQHDHIWNGGTLSTAGNVVFQGTAEGMFYAYDGRSGKELWHFDAGLGIVAAPMTYSVGGKQHVSILVGYGGTTAAFGDFMRMGWKYGQQPRRLLTFALDGKASLPKGNPADMSVKALDDPKLVLSDADVKAGSGLSLYCAACHGIGFKSPGEPGPDLRESPIALDFASFRQVVKGGALLERGMPRFDNLTDDQLRQIQAFIRAQARLALGKAAPSAAPPSALH